MIFNAFLMLELQNTALLVVEMQILIDFYGLTLWEKDTFKLNTSLSVLVRYIARSRIVQK